MERLTEPPLRIREALIKLEGFGITGRHISQGYPCEATTELDCGEFTVSAKHFGYFDFYLSNSAFLT